MQDTLQNFLATGVFAFILTFVRLGAALTIMPGIGDSFTPSRVRLFLAVGMSFVLAPLVMQYLPPTIPDTGLLLIMVGVEFLVGLFIGTIARVLMAATDTAGMLISMMSGLGNAQIFNPGSATQGSIVGALVSITAVMIIFSTELHHLLIVGLVRSYEMFPVGEVPDTGSMSEVMTEMVSKSFLIGVQISAPFMVISLLIYVGMGVLTRLMPQVQVFLIAIPLQILLSFVSLVILMSALLLFWSRQFADNMILIFGGG